MISVLKNGFQNLQEVQIGLEQTASFALPTCKDPYEIGKGQKKEPHNDFYLTLATLGKLKLQNFVFYISDNVDDWRTGQGYVGTYSDYSHQTTRPNSQLTLEDKQAWARYLKDTILLDCLLPE